MDCCKPEPNRDLGVDKHEQYHCADVPNGEVDGCHELELGFGRSVSGADCRVSNSVDVRRGVVRCGACNGKCLKYMDLNGQWLNLFPLKHACWVQLQSLVSEK